MHTHPGGMQRVLGAQAQLFVGGTSKPRPRGRLYRWTVALPSPPRVCGVDLDGEWIRISWDRFGLAHSDSQQMDETM